MSKHEQCDASKYYDDLNANIYDDLWGFTFEYVAEFAVKHLQLKPDDLLADIGGGTGAISHLIWKKSGIKNIATITAIMYTLIPSLHCFYNTK